VGEQAAGKLEWSIVSCSSSTISRVLNRFGETDENVGYTCRQ
jgi:hypothetical protein